MAIEDAVREEPDRGVRRGRGRPPYEPSAVRVFCGSLAITRS